MTLKRPSHRHGSASYQGRILPPTIPSKRLWRESALMGNRRSAAVRTRSLAKVKRHTEECRSRALADYRRVRIKTRNVYLVSPVSVGFDLRPSKRPRRAKDALVIAFPSICVLSKTITPPDASTTTFTSLPGGTGTEAGTLHRICEPTGDGCRRAQSPIATHVLSSVSKLRFAARTYIQARIGRARTASISIVRSLN
jgi:hypothetical protein